MSWNISTRLNNLQQQINNIANKGLTNPLEQVLDANNYSLTNLNILDSGSNVLELQSSNVGGITTNCDFSADGNITCHTLNYNSLNPPININGITYSLNGQNIEETTTGNFTITQFNPYNGFITNQKVLNPSASLTINFDISTPSNSVAIGFSSSNNLYPNSGFLSIQTGIYYYPSQNAVYNITGGALGSIQYPYIDQKYINIQLLNIDGIMKVYINGSEANVLNQPLVGSYYFVCSAYMASTVSLSITDCIVNQSSNLTLNQVLLNGNDASNQNILGINELTCETLNYTTLNPPISESQNLEAVLTSGNNANGLNIINLGSLSSNSIGVTGTINCNLLEITNNTNNISQINFNYSNGSTTGNNYQMSGATGDIFKIQQYKEGIGLFNQPLIINDVEYIQFKSNNLLYTLDGATINYILDSYYNPPMYKQVFTSQAGTVTGLGISASPLFNVPIYSKSTPYNYGVNFGEINISNINITFSSLSAFPSGLNATLFLSSSYTNPYNPNNGNSLVIPINNTEGQPNSTFNSVIPIILSYSNTTQFKTLYLMIEFNTLGLNLYECAIGGLNMVVSGYISSNQNGTLTWS
jgi:hypothetical protein